jgi:membrane associated rhomboid family serine protease
MVFIPIKDINRRIWVRFHYVTVALIALCAAVFALQIAGGAESGQRGIYGLGIIPAVLFGDAGLDPELVLVPSTLTLLTSLFLHGGFMHLIGNMLFLWVFGDNVEDSMGHARFLAFYLVCGVVAGIAHALSDPSSQVPTIGASGAVSGVLGAYLVLHPRVKIWVLAFVWLPLKLPAWVVLGLWAVLQLANTFLAGAAASGVAWWAHIAGFAAGAGLIRFFKYPHVVLFNQSEDGDIKVGGLRLRGHQPPGNEGDKPTGNGPPGNGPWGRR